MPHLRRQTRPRMVSMNNYSTKNTAWSSSSLTASNENNDGIIGGQAFLDIHNNNSHDDEDDVNLLPSNINIWLFTCNNNNNNANHQPSQPIAYYQTSSSNDGTYKFTNLTTEQSYYYTIIVQLPTGYEFSTVWSEEPTPSSSQLISDNYSMMSTINPNKGQTICFNIQQQNNGNNNNNATRNMNMDWNIGLIHDNSLNDSQPPSSESSSVAEPTISISTASNVPSYYPSKIGKETNTPSSSPSNKH